MKNRAKCKLCKSVIESLHRYDEVSCKCGEISISGGNDLLLTAANNWVNFLRVDDQDNEISVKVVEKGKHATETDEPKALSTRSDKLAELKRMVENIERLPQSAMSAPIDHYSFYSLILLISSILDEST